MNRITLFPRDGDAQINTVLAEDVDFTGMDPAIHCVQWYEDLGQGTIEYVGDPITGFKPQNEVIYDITPYMPYALLAQAMIEKADNPDVYFVTAKDLVYGELELVLGDPIEIGTLDTQPPAQTTQQVPPTPEDYQQLYWYNNAEWVISGFDPNLTLAQAKESLITKVQTSAAEQGNIQARIYSAYQLGSASDIGTLPTADYFGVDLATYQTYLNGEVSTMTATINAATTNSQLYQFDWRVEGDPNA